LARDAPEVPPERDVEPEVVFEGERCRGAPAELDARDRKIPDDARDRARVHGEKREPAASGVTLERAGRARNAVGFVVRIAEQRNSRAMGHTLAAPSPGIFASTVSSAAPIRESPMGPVSSSKRRIVERIQSGPPAGHMNDSGQTVPSQSSVTRSVQYWRPGGYDG